MVQPKININVKSNFSLGGGTPFATAALIGSSEWGEIDTVETWESFGDIKTHYKAGTIVDGAEQFFATGGRVLMITRIGDGSEVASAETFDSTATPVLTITGKYKGVYGDNISVAITANSTTSANRDVKITDGVIIETFKDLATNDAVAAAINATSTLVTAAVETGQGTTNLVDAITATPLTGGDSGTTSITSTNYTTALENKLWLENWDYLIIPDETLDAFHTSIVALLDTRAVEENKYSIYVTGVDKFESIATTTARTSTNDSGSLFVVHSALYVGTTTPAEDSTAANYLDGSYTACAYAGLLCRLPVNTSPTFKNAGILTAKSLTDVKYTRLEREQLISEGFTIITETIDSVIGPYMGVTRTSSNTLWSFMADNVRKVNFMKASIYELVKLYIGEPNDGSTRTSIKGTISGFYREQIDDRIIESYELEVAKGTDPRAVNVNTAVVLINETDYIDINMVLNV